MGTHRRSWVAVALIVTVAAGGCTASKAPSGFGGLSGPTVVPGSAGAPSPAPRPSATVPAGTTPTTARTSRTTTSAKSPGSKSSPMSPPPSYDNSQDFSVGVQVVDQHRQCYWVLQGSDVFVGAKFYIGYYGPSRPVNVGFALTNNINTHATGGDAGFGAVNYSVYAPAQSAAYSMRLTMQLKPGFLDADPKNDSTHVTVQVPAGSPPAGQPTPLACN